MSFLIAPYQATSGPRLLIAPESVEELRALEGLFLDLSNGAVSRGEISELLPCRLRGMSGLLLVRSRDRPGKALERAENGSSPGFTWTCDAEGWRETADLIHLMGTGPAHQYLTEEGINDAVVEVSFLEPSFARRVEEEAGGGREPGDRLAPARRARGGPLVRLVLAGAQALSLSACGPDWSLFSHSAGGFEIDMPGSVECSEWTATTPSVDLAGEECSVEVKPSLIPEHFPAIVWVAVLRASRGATVENIEAALVKQAGGELLQESTVTTGKIETLGGIPGSEFQIVIPRDDGGPLTVRNRYVVVGDRIYCVRIIGVMDRSRERIWSRAVSSFRLLPAR